jgi:phospholipase/lecithinase/hemolysin
MSGTTMSYSTIYSFGDSLSDAGNDSVLTAVTGATPVSPPYFHTNYDILGGLASQAATVFSNGPVWAQDLSQALGLGTLKPSLLGGKDYAYGGAETGSTPQNSGNVTVAATSLPAQLTEFGLGAGAIASTALVTLSIGGNDIFDILANNSLTAAQQAIDVADAVANEISAIHSLAKSGAKNFLVFNVPDLGLVPEVTQGLVNGSNTPSASLDALATSLSHSYDTQLARALGAEASTDGASIKILDAYSLLDDAAANPAAFGLTNTTTPVWSGNFTSSSSGTLAATTTATQDQYLFWDDFHPTAGIHQILANTAAALVTPAASTQATVTGAGGYALTLNFGTTARATQAQAQLSTVSAAIGAGAVIANAPTSGALPVLAAGQTGLAEIDIGAAIVLTAGYTTAIDVAAGPVTLVSAFAASELIVASGSGSLLYAAMAGAETIYAGAGSTLAFGNAASLDFFGGTGSATIVGGTAGNTVAGGDGSQVVFGTAALNYTGGGGAATLVGGAGGSTVAGGSGSVLAFANTSMSFTGGTGAATVVGGTGGLAATLGGGGAVFSGNSGNSSLSTGTGSANATLVGGGSGDILTASGSGADLLVAGGGAETLNGASATGSLILFGGSGAESLVGGAGSDLIVAGASNETLAGGAGNNNYLFFATAATTRIDTITDFDPTRNAIGLYGFGSSASADAAALGSAVTAGGNTTLSLTDGTKIVLVGAANLQSYNFF